MPSSLNEEEEEEDEEDEDAWDETIRRFECLTLRRVRLLLERCTQ